MTKQEKNEVIDLLKGKFSQYDNFYITDTESLSVAQIGKLRNHCFNKQVEMKVAKNTLIRKALESLDAEKYAGVFDSLHKVTALMFSDNPKEPAVILSGFRKEINGTKPELKAAFINGDVFVGDDQLKKLTQIKTKNELIGEVIGLLQSPIQRVLGALQNKDNAEVTAEDAPVEDVPVVADASTEVAATEVTPATEETPATEITPATEKTPAAEATATETPTAEGKAEEEKPAAE